jgi:uncharacterized protein (TIGR01777 family)
MKIVMPGGSGQVGTLLARAFQQDGHEVVVLSRKRYQAPWRVTLWDAGTVGEWAHEIEGADAVINLAGRSVNCRYTPENRRLIKESRVLSTRAVGAAIASAKQPPKVWLQASTATIYAHRYDAPNDEITGILGGAEPDVPDTWRFSIDVAQAWEQAADDANTPQTRKINMRSAMIMSADPGGVFDVLLRLVRHGLGGTEGDGRQYLSWIHGTDFIGAVYWLIEREYLAGAINLSSPEPLPNADFMRVLREAWGTPLGLPATEWMLEVGTFLMQSESELVLKSRRVIPARLLQDGFVFQFPGWPEAAQELCRQWRDAHSLQKTAA